MRTKTLFLTAAAVVAGFSAFAQVYSVNVVGYANSVWPGNKYTLVANPLDDGNGNQLTNLANSLPGGSAILTWGGISFNTATKVGANWNANAQLPPGKGFFVRNGKVPASPVVPDVTNTFVGSVVVGPGGSVTSSVPVAYELFGSPIPYAGNLAVQNTPSGDASLNVGVNLPAGSQILTWNQAGQTYNTYTKVGANWNGTAALGVAEGFFIRNKNGPVTNFVQTLP